MPQTSEEAKTSLKWKFKDIFINLIGKKDTNIYTLKKF